MKLKITVHGVAYEVEVEVLDPGDGFVSPNLPDPREIPRAPHSAAPPPISRQPATGVGANGVKSPVAGTVMELHCKPGDSVSAGDVVIVVEAMKMNTSITAPMAGRVKAVPVAVGDNVREGQMLVEFE